MDSKHILITGASSGIGYETALHLASKGHHITAIARSMEKLSELRSQNDSYINVVSADLSSEEAVDELIRRLGRGKRKLDGLINNAGLLVNKPFEALSDHDWRKMIEINLMAPVRICKALIPFLNRGAHILNISSMGGYQQSRKFAGLSGYSTSKGGLAIFTECLAEELRSEEISVNCLCLGAVETEMFKTAFPGVSAPVQPGQMGAYISQFILDGHRYYNGKILPVALSDPD